MLSGLPRSSPWRQLAIMAPPLPRGIAAPALAAAAIIAGAAVPADAATTALSADAATPAVPAPAPPPVVLQAALAPERLGGGTTVTIGFHIDAPPEQLPSPLLRFDVRLPAGMGLAATTLGLATCS